jgi:hypothetical protein
MKTTRHFIENGAPKKKSGAGLLFQALHFATLEGANPAFEDGLNSRN